MSNKWINKLFPVLLGLVCFTSLVFASGKMITLSRPTAVYRGPSTSSEILGRYPQGTRFKTESEEDGWYTIRFSRPFKGADIGWIKASDIQDGVRSGSGSRNAREQNGSSSFPHRSYNYSVALQYGSYGASVSELKTALGESTITQSATYMGGEVAYLTNGGWIFGGGLGSYSYTHTLTVLSGETYTSGVLGDLRLGLRFLHKPRFEVYGGANLGFTFFTMGTKTTSNTAETAGIVGPFYGGWARLRWRMAKSIALDGDVGYHMMSFNAVPKYQTSAIPINLSGIFWRVGLAFLW